MKRSIRYTVTLIPLFLLFMGANILPGGVSVSLVPHNDHPTPTSQTHISAPVDARETGKSILTYVWEFVNQVGELSAGLLVKVFPEAQIHFSQTSMGLFVLFIIAAIIMALLFFPFRERR